MGKIILGLSLGLIIGIGCRCFDIPLPGPPKFVGALIIAAVTMGYIGADFLLARHAKTTGLIFRRPTTSQFCAGPTGLPPSAEQQTTRSQQETRS